jgi:IclR family pca regulon transcriptional regulator
MSDTIAEGRAAGDATGVDDDGRERIDPRYVVPGLSRGLALLQLFTRHKPAQTLAELAAGLELSRSAAYRLVYTLEKDGFIAREPTTRRYSLTSKVLTLGFEYFNSQTITEVAQPFLQRLSDATSASAHLVILDGWHAVYLARVSPSVGLVSNLQVGSRQPAHITASGRMLLADLPEPRLRTIHALLRHECRSVAAPESFEALRHRANEDRARGYVFHKSVIDPGLTSCAAAVRDGAGTAVAAITIVGPDRNIETFGGEPALARLIVEATGAMSAKLGYGGG